MGAVNAVYREATVEEKLPQVRSVILSRLLTLHGRLQRSEDRVIECKFGSQVMMRLLGGAFISHTKLPKLAIVRLIETKQGGTTVTLEVREAVGVGFKVGMIKKLRVSLDRLAEEIMLAVNGIQAKGDVKGPVAAPKPRTAKPLKEQPRVEQPPPSETSGPFVGSPLARLRDDLLIAIRALKELDSASGSVRGSDDAEAERIRGEIGMLIQGIDEGGLVACWVFYDEARAGRLPRPTTEVLDTLAIRALTLPQILGA
jgi:hypothetical protein